MFRKQIPALLLLAVIINNCILYSVFFIHQHHSIREQLEKQIRHDYKKLLLETLVFQKGSFNYQRLSDGKILEFSYNNNMYDIVEIKKSTGYIEVLAVNDTKEKELVNNFSKLQNQQGSQGRNLNKSFAFQPLCPIENFYKLDYSYSTSFVTMPFSKSGIISQYITPTEPPPKSQLNNQISYFL